MKFTKDKIAGGSILQEKRLNRKDRFNTVVKRSMKHGPNPVEGDKNNIMSVIINKIIK